MNAYDFNSADSHQSQQKNKNFVDDKSLNLRLAQLNSAVPEPVMILQKSLKSTTTGKSDTDKD